MRTRYILLIKQKNSETLKIAIVFFVFFFLLFLGEKTAIEKEEQFPVSPFGVANN